MGLLDVRVTPRSSQSRILVEGRVVRVWVHAAATDGEANAAVLRLLAKSLGVAPSLLVIVRGESSRHKVIDVPMDGAAAIALLSR